MPRNRGRHAMSLGLNLGLSNPGLVGAFVPPTPHKSAGRAFAFSLLLPGLGQLYCGKKARGWVTLACWLLGLIFAFSSHEGLKGTGVIVVFVLWIFSFLDAYFTAIEINRGRDLQVDAENPRVAVTLNLLTAGFGYFYLGERIKGTVIFVVTQFVRFGTPKLTGYLGGVVSLALVVFQMLMGADAYRIARMQLKESLPPETAPATGEESRLPVFIPIGLASAAAVLFIGFLVFGVALIAVRGPRIRPAAVRAQSQPVSTLGLSAPGKTEAHVAPASAVDLTSAVEQVQWLERQTERRKENIPELKRDVEIFNSALKNGKIDAADVAVAHYYRAEALRLVNSIHEREGEALEPAAAKGAIADFDNVISARANTYIPAVNVTNAEYLAGSVARNYLRSYSLAYRYWQKCALEGHAGCLHLMATARLTGDGGQKIDVNEALDLHTVVFNTGVRYRCAGAESALSIAEIGYFTGVRRPGDDEFQWVNKSNALMDRLEAADGNKDVCHRAQAEVEEFLLQLSSGQRNENILQDAAARLGEESPTTKAAIQLLSGSASDTEFESAVQASKSESDRCSAYFDATWYAAIMSQDVATQRYHRRLKEIGKFHCGTELAFASKFKP
jgi:TM2 domain-containing membrane protein YozV